MAAHSSEPEKQVLVSRQRPSLKGSPGEGRPTTGTSLWSTRSRQAEERCSVLPVLLEGDFGPCLCFQGGHHTVGHWLLSGFHLLLGFHLSKIKELFIKS